MPSQRIMRLSPAVVPERVVLGNGRQATVYRCPYPADGPVRVDTDDGGSALTYMYAHFVFTWREGTARVDIGHGTVERSTPLWPAQPISGEWSTRALACFGEWWALRHLAMFRHKRPVAPCFRDKSHLS